MCLNNDIFLETFFLFETQEVTKKMCGTPAISSLQFALWILGNFATVAEVQEALEKESFPLVFEQKLKSEDEEYSFELHFSVIDKTGAGIIIEFTEQGRKVHMNTIGVMTNSPTYDFHMMNLRNYIHLSKYARDPLVLGQDEFKPLGEGTGLLGAPGDLTPTSRFVRAAILTHFAAPAKTSKEAVNLAVHIMNTGDIPHGILSDHSHPKFADYTNWIVVKDLKNKALYYRTYEDLTVRVVYLDNVQPGKMLKLTLASPIGGFKDTTDEMKPFKGHSEL